MNLKLDLFSAAVAYVPHNLTQRWGSYTWGSFLKLSGYTYHDLIQLKFMLDFENFNFNVKI